MFTCNTRDSSSVNSEGKAQGIYTVSELSSVLLINTDEGWLTGLYYCKHTNYHVSRLDCVLFSRKLECSAKQLVAANLSYCWLYSSKQAVDRFMLFTYLDRVLFSHLECSVKQVLTVDLSVRAVGAGR